MKRLITTLPRLAILGATLAAASAQGAIIFTDDFSGATPGNYGAGSGITGSQFKVTNGDADVVGDLNGSFFGCPGGPNKNCVDTNGNYPGTLQTKNTLALLAGVTYTVQFDIAGNGQAGDYYTIPYTIDVNLGNSTTHSFSAAALSPLAAQQFTYTPVINESATLQFVSTSYGYPGYWGVILENVQVTAPDAPAAAPEPGTMALAGLALVGVGFIRRKR